MGDVRLPNSPYGLNQYAHIHNAVLLSALNPSPAYFSFLKHMAGLDSEAVRTGTYLETVYQSASRISLRDRASTAPKRVIVMDRDAGEWLRALFPGASLQRLTDEPIIPPAGRPGRRMEYTDAAERMRAYRARKRARSAP